MIRVYLAGEVQLESGARLVREADLPARQGRVAFALLADRRAHPVARQEMADVLWPNRLPDAWAVALSAIISKLRVALEGVGLSRESTIVSALGCYQLRLPDDAWVDLEVAAAAIHNAEAEISRGSAERGYGDALVALTILRRPFLPGTTGAWVENRREALRGELIRALDGMISCQTVTGELELAVRNAEELVGLEPFRESGYRHLMRIHAARGDRAEALRVYETCRARLVEELGVGPSAETSALQLALLKAN